MGLESLDAKFKYIQICQDLPTYGVTFFLVKVIIFLHFNCGLCFYIFSRGSFVIIIFKLPFVGENERKE